MRRVALFLRSRITGRAVALLVASAAITWLWLLWDSSSGKTAVFLPVAMPLLAATTIGACTRSPFGEQETTAGFPIGALRGSHLLGLLALAALTLALAVSGWAVKDSAWLLVRNLAGLTGLALVAAAVVGAGLSWIAPLAYAIVALGAEDGGYPSLWVWPVLAATDRVAGLIALALLALGLLLVAHAGARDQPGEST